MRKFTAGLAVGLVIGDFSALSIIVAVLLFMLPYVGLGILHLGPAIDHALWKEIREFESEQGLVPYST